MSEQLFVYGTLALGQPNEHILQKLGGSWQKGSVKGHLYEEGWGADMGYPGIRLDQSGATISGYVFSSKKLNAYWPALDKFEGEAYVRVKTKVTLEDKTEVEAFIYALR